MTPTELEAQAIWVNKTAATGYQVMGDGRHFYGEKMELYVPLSAFLPYSQAAIAAAMMGAVRLADGIAGNTKDHHADYRRAAGQIGALIKASIHPDAMAALDAVKADAELRGIDIARKHLIERGHLAAAAAIRAMQGG